MTVELSHFCLVLALILSIVQSVLPIIGTKTGDERLMATAPATSVAIFCFLLLSYVGLTQAHVLSDFSVRNVWENSHSLKPLLYKYSGVWGNHEGSMLLWVLILGFFSAMLAIFGNNLPTELKTNTLAVQGWVMLAFLSFVVITSNPFERLVPAPFEGKDLNPVLQDVGLAIHPPLLYLGYVGFSVTFSFAVAAMISGRIDAAWARWVRPWALLAWIFLTVGIAMGSYWAYYELGWGGWWFWDPVENASFIPWLFGTALLHSALVMEKREALKIWTILLALITFSMSLLGTFLVRSGVLTSVHAFASDPERGIFILGILILFIGGSLTLFAIRAPLLKSGGLFAPISREGALVFNNLFLSTAGATVLIGTLYPLLAETLTGAKISVGAPFFNLTFGPLMIPLLILLPMGPLLSWKRADFFGVINRLYFAFVCALLISVITYAYTSNGPVLASLGIGLAVWVMVGALSEIAMRSAFSKVGFATGVKRLVGLPRPVWGTAFAHFGVGVTMLGIVSVTAFQQEYIGTMKPGDTVEFAGYSMTLQSITPNRGSNFVEDVVAFSVNQGGSNSFIMKPTKRIYTTRGMPTTESAIKTFVFSQLYLSLGEVEKGGEVVVRAWWKPFVTLIWIGSLFMAFGGVISLSDRRLRVGAPKPSRARIAKEAGGETA